MTVFQNHAIVNLDISFADMGRGSSKFSVVDSCWGAPDLVMESATLTQRFILEADLCYGECRHYLAFEVVFVNQDSHACKIASLQVFPFC